MPCETIDQEINGVLYVTTQWSATKQILMKLKLVNTFGDALFDVVQGMTSKATGDEKEKTQIAAFRSATNTLFKTSTPEVITALLKDMLTCGATKRDGTRITKQNFDNIYNDAGIKEMYTACLFVVKSNYADFFKGQKAGDLLAKVEENL